MSEKGLWGWLGGILPSGQYSRIESGDTCPGFPDVHCQFSNGSSATLELKFARNPNARIPFTDKHGLRQSQVIWIRDNLRYSGRVFIIAEVPPEIFVIPGASAKKFNGATRPELLEMAWVVLWRSRPEEAAKYLQKLLMGDERCVTSVKDSF